MAKTSAYTIAANTIILCLALLWAAAPGRAAGQTELDVLIDEALGSNPAIAAMHSRTEALRQRPSQAAAWDDPKLTFGVSNLPVDSFDFNEQDMTQKTVSLSQNIPFPGIPALKKQAAAEAALSAGQERVEQETRTVRDVKKIYYSLYFTNRALEITSANEGLLEKFVQLTQAKYEVGSGLQEDILKAQVQLAKLQERLITLRQQRATFTAALRSLLNRPEDRELGITPSLSVTPFDADMAPYTAQALAANPRLKALEHLIEQAEAQHRLAKKMYVPRFSITAAYGQRDDRRRAKPFPANVRSADGSSNNVTVTPLTDDRDRPDFFSLMVGVNIPIWFRSKQNKGVAEAWHRIAEAKALYSSAKNEVQFQMSDLDARLSRNRELIRLYEGNIIPQARQSLEADMAAYQVAKIDFLTLLNSQITLFNYEIQYQRAMTDHEIALAELEAVVGKRLF